MKMFIPLTGNNRICTQFKFYFVFVFPPKFYHCNILLSSTLKCFQLQKDIYDS